MVRRRYLRPEFLVGPLKDFLRELEQLLGAIGQATEETMWSEAAKRVDEVIDVLKRPSELYLAIRKLEQEDLEEQLAGEERARAAAAALVRKLPRKKQAWIKEPRRRHA